MTDLLIIGAGTAGLTAAIYGLRAGLTVDVVEQTIYGGQIITTSSIENYPGMPGISGADFAVALYTQAKELGANILYETIQELDLAAQPKTIRTAEGQREAKSVIVATGAQPRKIGCPGEERFTGRGVSFCATCDGAFHKGKDVAVVGGGNVALGDAMVLSGLCRTVYLIHRGTDFTGEQHTLSLLKKKSNVVFLTESEVMAVEGENQVAAVVVRNRTTNAHQTLPVSGMFVAIGAVPNNQLFQGQLTLDDVGYIVAGEDCRTNLPGVYAAGDTRTKEIRQIVTAAADGSVAALAAKDYIDHL